MEVDWLKTNFSLSDLWNVVKRNVQIWDSVFLIGVDALFVSWVETFVELPRILDKLKTNYSDPKQTAVRSHLERAKVNDKPLSRHVNNALLSFGIIVKAWVENLFVQISAFLSL